MSTQIAACVFIALSALNLFFEFSRGGQEAAPHVEQQWGGMR